MSSKKDRSTLAGRIRLEIPYDLEWIRSRPKAELHVHLLGAIRPATAFELAQKHSVPPPIFDQRDWTSDFSTGSLESFVARFISLFDLVLDTEDFHRVALEFFEDCHQDGIAYAEPRITLTSHLSRGASIQAIREGLTCAAKEAKRNWNVHVGWIVDFPRILGFKVGEEALRLAVEGRRWGVVGFDVAGYEGHYGEDSRLRDLFIEAKRQGLGTTAHVGEVGPPENVRVAVFEWKVDRIGHGVSIAEDPGLLAQIVEKRIPIEINVASNLKLGRVASREEHPVERFRQAGAPIIINTDDPSLFGVTLSEEIQQCASAFGWDRQIVQAVIDSGWEHMFSKRMEPAP